MHTHTAPNHTPTDSAAPPAVAGLRPPGASGPRSLRTDFPYSSHGRAALATALGDGLMPDEVRRILSGRRVADAFPVRRGESPAAYAPRAVAEMFAAYLS